MYSSTRSVRHFVVGTDDHIARRQLSASKNSLRLADVLARIEASSRRPAANMPDTLAGHQRHRLPLRIIRVAAIADPAARQVCRTGSACGRDTASPASKPRQKGRTWNQRPDGASMDGEALQPVPVLIAPPHTLPFMALASQELNTTQISTDRRDRPVNPADEWLLTCCSGLRGRAFNPARVQRKCATSAKDTARTSCTVSGPPASSRMALKSAYATWDRRVGAHWTEAEDHSEYRCSRCGSKTKRANSIVPLIARSIRIIARNCWRTTRMTRLSGRTAP